MTDDDQTEPGIYVTEEGDIVDSTDPDHGVIHFGPERSRRLSKKLKLEERS